MKYKKYFFEVVALISTITFFTAYSMGKTEQITEIVPVCTPHHINLNDAIVGNKIDDVKKIIICHPGLYNDFLRDWTPLYKAVVNNYVEIAQFLLRQPRIEIDKGRVDGKSPLAAVKDFHLCKTLLSFGANPNKKCNKGYPAFMYAASSHTRRADVLELMMINGARPNEIVNGHTVLMEIVTHFSPAFKNVFVLLMYGAGVTQDIIDKARERELNPYLIRLLEDYSNACKCTKCPRWFPRVVYKNQMTPVCAGCLHTLLLAKY